MSALLCEQHVCTAALVLCAATPTRGSPSPADAPSHMFPQRTIALAHAPPRATLHKSRLIKRCDREAKEKQIVAPFRGPCVFGHEHTSAVPLTHPSPATKRGRDGDAKLCREAETGSAATRSWLSPQQRRLRHFQSKLLPSSRVSSPLRGTGDHTPREPRKRAGPISVVRASRGHMRCSSPPPLSHLRARPPCLVLYQPPHPTPFASQVASQRLPPHAGRHPLLHPSSGHGSASPLPHSGIHGRTADASSGTSLRPPLRRGCLALSAPAEGEFWHSQGGGSR